MDLLQLSSFFIFFISQRRAPILLLRGAWMETQLKGKAAIDIVCNPLGKSGGSAIQQLMIISFGSLAASTPYLGFILLGIVVLWLNAARSLSTQVAPCVQHPSSVPHLCSSVSLHNPILGGWSREFVRDMQQG